MYCAKNSPDLISPHKQAVNFLAHCIQHMEAKRSATDTKSDVASIPGGSGGHQGRNVIIT